MKLIYSLFTLCLVSLGFYAQAQVTLERQVVASTGNQSTSGNVSISSTVGEAVSTYLISGSLSLSQGFQQADLGTVGIEELPEVVVDYTIYPNPTADELHIRFQTEKMASLQVRLFDMNGRALEGFSRHLEGNGQLETSFSLVNLPSAIYMVSILDAEGQVLVSHKVRRQ
ncbi:MAG: T9SS type A sorting domain-containing protein [Bacteroidia bacterium]